jgi:aminomethyltransferase
MALREPPLRGVHAERGASFTEFGGWEMPVEFDSIGREHAAVREAVGIFDVSHMGEIEVTGPDATRLVDRLTTNDVTALDPYDAQYAAVTREDGVMLDDTVVYRRPDADGEPSYLFVPNAGHDEATHERWVAHRDEWGLDATVHNATDEYAMFAVQGPDAVGLVADAAADGRAVRNCSRFTAVETSVAGVDCWIARTGYTGEDGVELLLPATDATAVWAAFADDATPCGLGARDTLRIEAGFLLSGQDFDPEDEPRTPYEAGIGFAVKLGTEFVGRDALERVDAEGVDERLTGLELLDRGVPRHGYDVTHDGAVVGRVTSGTMSPTLETPIALAYLPTDLARPGTRIGVVVRGETKRAKTVSTPFIDR